ncbi:hypothetical protein DUI87_26434 [Hirundo rustica rustica]|uniref:Sorting nexin/Vps5-like C-terminal domain-containing protein n=1 Tax=Hirundo rustica rustica TaxID=333673 RepID=A0A3M0JA72_HIRRU|nr:hypothetical protein DUI87_26434 [Hirundo rustica rustica]
MAAEREPPPLGETRPADLEELEDGEDLFTSTVSTLESSPSSPDPASLPAEDLSTNSNGPKPAEIMLDGDREDLFAEATEEVSLDSPERDPILSPEPTPAVTPVTPTTLIAPRMESKSVTAPVIFDRSREEIEEEANGDLFDIEINVSDPEKVGMTKVKVGKEDSSSTEFVEKRRAALERVCFDHRMKCWQKWQDAQVTLQKKREAEAKLQLANKPDKLQQAKDEIKEKERVKDFKTVIIEYLESLVQTQQQLIKYWEAFLPEAKAIA